MKELERNREILKLYKEIPSGVFGAVMIRDAIWSGEKAIADGDTVAMISAYKELEATK